MMQFQAAVCEAGHNGIVCDHDDGASLGMHFTQLAEYDFFIHGVKVAGRFVGQDDVWIVDQSTGNADALLLAAGKLRRQMIGAVPRPTWSSAARASDLSVMLWKYCASMMFSRAVR